MITKLISLAVLPLLGLFVSAADLLAQTPTHYPTGGEPVRWTPVNILVYIVIPVVLVAVWIILRRRKTRKEPGNKGG